MSIDEVFQAANAVALLCWLGLVLLPRGPWLWRLGAGALALLCTVYAALVGVFLFPSGGSFSSLEGVQRLFASRPVLLAGWIHDLAFDLFTGGWLARRMDALSVSRWLQAPILFVTFMVGPVGLLVGGAVLAALTRRWVGEPSAAQVRHAGPGRAA